MKVLKRFSTLTLVLYINQVVRSERENKYESSEKLEDDIPLAFGDLIRIFKSNQNENQRMENEPSTNSGFPESAQNLDYPQSSASPTLNLSKSSPGCPEPFEGRPYVYFGDSDRCFVTGEQGPCPENMRLFQRRSSYRGYCDCNCNNYFGTRHHPPQRFCTGRDRTGLIRTLTYVKQWDTCQPLFEQSYCPNEQWLIFDENPKIGPLCAKRMCPASQYNWQLVFYDYSTGSCHTLGDDCTKFSYNEENIEGSRTNFYYTYQIQDSDWIPSCVSRYHGRSNLESYNNPSQCPPGQYRISPRSKKCQYRPEINFNSWSSSL